MFRVIIESILLTGIFLDSVEFGRECFAILVYDALYGWLHMRKWMSEATVLV